MHQPFSLSRLDRTPFKDFDEKSTLIYGAYLPGGIIVSVEAEIKSSKQGRKSKKLNLSILSNHLLLVFRLYQEIGRAYPSVSKLKSVGNQSAVESCLAEILSQKCIIRQDNNIVGENNS